MFGSDPGEENHDDWAVVGLVAVLALFVLGLVSIICWTILQVG